MEEEETKPKYEVGDILYTFQIDKETNNITSKTFYVNTISIINGLDDAPDVILYNDNSDNSYSENKVTNNIYEHIYRYSKFILGYNFHQEKFSFLLKEEY